MKKYFCVVLSVLLLALVFFSVSSAAEIAASGTCGDDLDWILDDAGTLTISGTGEMDDYRVRFYITLENTEIRYPWYDYRDEIRSVIISPGTTRIGNQAFASCPELISVSIPDTVTDIGGGAFGDSPKLSEIVIPDSVTIIEKSAFSQCKGLLNVTLSTQLTEIGEFAFSYCENLEEINAIPEGVTALETGTFSYCGKLETVELPSGLKSIGESALANCTSLKNIQIPNGVTNIGNSAFFNCGSLKDIVIPAGIQQLGFQVFTYCEALESVTLKEGLKTIGSNTFYSCRSLLDPIFPSSLTSIGDYAFDMCDSIENVVIPYGVKTIGYRAFAGNSIKNISLSDSVTSIGEEAFYGQYTNVTIPVGVQQIGRNAFFSYRLSEINVVENNPYFCSEDGILYNKNKTTLVRYPVAQSFENTSFTVPDGVTEIGDSAFYYSGNTGCRLQTIILPESLTRIGYGAFMNCDNIRSMFIPDGVLEIGEKAFYLCNIINSIRLPASLVRIGRGAFDTNLSFSTVTYDGARCQWDRISVDVWNDKLTGAAITCKTEHVETTTQTVLTPATCTAAGELQTAVACSVCGEAISRTTSEIGMVPHVLIQHEGKAPTYTEPGWEPYETCENCEFTTFKALDPLTPADPPTDPYENLSFSFEDGILFVSGTGAVPAADNADETPFAHYAGECKVLVIQDGIESVQANAFLGLDFIEMLILQGPIELTADAFSLNGNMNTVICADAVQVDETSFAENMPITVYEPKLSPHSGDLPENCTVLPYSFSEDTLYIEGTAQMDTYDLLDLMAIMCSYYDDVHFAHFDSYTSLDVPFYVYDKSVKEYVPAENNTLTGVSFSVKIPDGKDWVTITFNVFCELAASGRLGEFHLVSDLEVGEDPGDQPGDHPEDGDVQDNAFQIMEQAVRKVLKWIVGLLNYMFNILSKFK